MTSIAFYLALGFFTAAEVPQLRERIYVQTDKELYLSGETILLKLITTDQSLKPLIFSKIAYVELVSDTDYKLQIIVELKNGIGTGEIILPVDFPTGYYRLIAYTQFMRNEGENVFFEKNIGVINTFQWGYYITDEINPTNIPLQNTKKKEVAPTLHLDKSTYPQRTRGEFTISGLPENIHTLSVSITGKEIFPCIESCESLFLKNHTEGLIEFSGTFLPEFEGHIVTGLVVDNKTEKEQYEPLLESAIGFPAEGIRFYAGKNRENGEVLFVTSGISGTKEIATVIFNAGEKYRIDIKSPFISKFNHKPLDEFRIDTVYYETLLARSVALQLLRYFSDDFSENQIISDSYFKAEPDFSFILEEYTRFTTMREVFTEFVDGARFRRKDGKWEISVLTNIGGSFEYGSMPLVMLDGVPIKDHNDIFNYDPHNIEKINIYMGPFALGGYMFDGVVELTTYNRKHEDLNFNRATQILAYDGPQTQFNKETPDYSIETNRKSRIPDGRHTLLWKPDIKTDGKHSIIVPFDTSDLTGEFQATLQGITKEGEFINATIFFKVE